MALTEIDYDELDPGIREQVSILRSYDYETTDSGDGVSKPDMECALPFPHVFVLSSLDRMEEEAYHIQEIFPEARVEVSWSPGEPVIIMVMWTEVPEVVFSELDYQPRRILPHLEPADE